MEYTQAINKLLGYIGSHPIDNYTTSMLTTHPEVARAHTLIEEKLSHIQRKHYWFNIKRDQTLTPNSSGVITVSSTVKEVFVQGKPEYVLDGGMLWDTKENTQVFSGEITADLRIEYEFMQVPEIVRDVVVYQAAEEFVIMELEDLNRAQHLNRKWASLYVELERERIRRGQYNLYNRPIAQRIRYGVRPYHGRRVR